MGTTAGGQWWSEVVGSCGYVFFYSWYIDGTFVMRVYSCDEAELIVMVALDSDLVSVNYRIVAVDSHQGIFSNTSSR